MSRYRLVHVRLWADEKFRALSPAPANGQTLFVYLITGPHTGIIPGLFEAGEAAMAEALGWPMKAFRRCFEEIRAKGMAVADWRARLVWLPNAPKHNPPKNPNIVKAWSRAFAELPECALKRRAGAELLAFLSTDQFGKQFSELFSEQFHAAAWNGLANGLAIQDQEQYQEQDQEQESPRRPPKGGAAPGFDEFWSVYPKKQDEADARKAWNKLRPDEPLRAEILAALERQKTWPQWTKDGGEFIPNADKWLTKRRWTDEAPARRNGNARAAVNDAWKDYQTGEAKQ